LLVKDLANTNGIGLTSRGELASTNQKRLLTGRLHWPVSSFMVIKNRSHIGSRITSCLRKTQIDIYIHLHLNALIIYIGVDIHPSLDSSWPCSMSYRRRGPNLFEVLRVSKVKVTITWKPDMSSTINEMTRQEEKCRALDAEIARNEQSLEKLHKLVTNSNYDIKSWEEVPDTSECIKELKTWRQRLDPSFFRLLIQVSQNVRCACISFVVVVVLVVVLNNTDILLVQILCSDLETFICIDLCHLYTSSRHIHLHLSLSLRYVTLPTSDAACRIFLPGSSILLTLLT